MYAHTSTLVHDETIIVARKQTVGWVEGISVSYYHRVFSCVPILPCLFFSHCHCLNLCLAATDESADAVAAAVADRARLRYSAKELAVWLGGQLTRWGMSYDKATADAVLQCYEDDTWREGQSKVKKETLSVAGGLQPLPLPLSDPAEVDGNELTLDPFSFGHRFVAPTDHGPDLSDTPHTQKEYIRFQRDLRALSALETTLHLLRTSDPESWTTAERMAILATLMDKIGNSHALKVQRLASYHARLGRGTANRIDDIPDEPSFPLPLDPVKVARCSPLTYSSPFLNSSLDHRFLCRGGSYATSQLYMLVKKPLLTTSHLFIKETQSKK